MAFSTVIELSEVIEAPDAPSDASSSESSESDFDDNPPLPDDVDSSPMATSNKNGQSTAKARPDRPMTAREKVKAIQALLNDDQQKFFKSCLRAAYFNSTNVYECNINNGFREPRRPYHIRLIIAHWNASMDEFSDNKLGALADALLSATQNGPVYTRKKPVDPATFRADMARVKAERAKGRAVFPPRINFFIGHIVFCKVPVKAELNALGDAVREEWHLHQNVVRIDGRTTVETYTPPDNPFRGTLIIPPPKLAKSTNNATEPEETVTAVRGSPK